MDQTGVCPDPHEVHVIQEMKPPTNVKELCQFLGMINQLSKFLPFLVDQSKPLHDLLGEKTSEIGDITNLLLLPMSKQT